MAPKRTASRKQTDNDDDDKQDPTWDSTPRNLMLYLLRLRRWLPRQHPKLMSYLRQGYILNSKQEVVVYDDNHKKHLIAGTVATGTFENPCRIRVSSGFEFFSPPESEESAGEEAEGEKPPDKKATKPDKTPGTAASSALVGTEPSRFKISPEALAQFEEEVVETVLDTFLDEDTQEEYAERCGGSIRELLRILHTDSRGISAADTTNIETRQDELYKRGIDEPTLAAFNSFKTRYRAFNLARKVPKTDGQMAIDYSQVTARLGDNIELRLESKLDANKGHGNLKKTIEAIREVLSKFESTKDTNFLLTGKSGAAYLGRDPKKGHDKRGERDRDRKPGRIDTSKPWGTECRDPCPNKAKLGCDGKHWKKDCPKKVTSTESTNPLAKDGKSNLSHHEAEAAAAALFSSGSPQKLSLSSLETPEQLLAALASSGDGRSLMGRAALEDDEDDDEHDHETTTTVATTTSTPAATMMTTRRLRRHSSSVPMLKRPRSM